MCLSSVLKDWLSNLAYTTNYDGKICSIPFFAFTLFIPLCRSFKLQDGKSQMNTLKDGRTILAINIDKKQIDKKFIVNITMLIGNIFVPLFEVIFLFNIDLQTKRFARVIVAL